MWVQAPLVNRRGRCLHPLLDDLGNPGRGFSVAERKGWPTHRRKAFRIAQEPLRFSDDPLR